MSDPKKGRAPNQRPDGDAAHGSRCRPALLLAVCLIATGCQRDPTPLDKAFDAIGGRDALLELRGFSYESSGDRFEAAQGLTPVREPVKASSFSLTLRCDLENDRLSFDWQRQIFDPLRGELTYEDVVDGDSGYQTGDDSVRNPPGASSDRALRSERIGAIRREFRLLNPHVYLRAAALNEEAATIKEDVELDGQAHHVVEVFDEVYPVELFLDAESGRLSRIRTLQNDHLFGDVATEVTYKEWSAPEGSSLKFPREVELSVGGNTLRTAIRTDVTVNPDFPTDAFALPEEPSTTVDQAAAARGGVSSQYLTRWHAMGVPIGDQDQISVVATPVQGDPEIQHLTGGSHHSLAIKLGEEILVVEPSLNEARSRAVLNKLEEIWPGVPVGHLILTHHHFDHMGGIRTYAAAGATIVTSELNSSYVEEALTSSHTLVRDELAQVATPEWRIEAVPVDGEFSLDEAGGTVKARHVATIHSEDMLVVYFPKAGLVFVTDIYMPGLVPPGQPLPAPFSEWAPGFRDGLASLGWEPEWLAGGHGGVAPFSDLLLHVGD